MTNKERFFRNNKGQARLTESILAVGLILLIFTTSIYFMSASKVWTIYEKGDLDKLGYNLLSYLLNARVIDNLEPSSAKAQLKYLLERNLPPMIFFNLIIYNCTLENDGSTGKINLKKWLTVNNTGTDPDAFEVSVEVSSTSVIYTSKEGEIHILLLTLARSEGGIKKE